jgi:hypothetical protein
LHPTLGLHGYGVRYREMNSVLHKIPPESFVIQGVFCFELLITILFLPLKKELLVNQPRSFMTSLFLRYQMKRPALKALSAAIEIQTAGNP